MFGIASLLLFACGLVAERSVARLLPSMRTGASRVSTELLRHGHCMPESERRKRTPGCRFYSNSLVRRRAGQPGNTGDAMAIALRGYAPTPAGADDELQIRWDTRRAGGLCYAWAFPTDQGTTNVGYANARGPRVSGALRAIDYQLANDVVSGCTCAGPCFV